MSFNTFVMTILNSFKSDLFWIFIWQTRAPTFVDKLQDGRTDIQIYRTRGRTYTFTFTARSLYKMHKMQYNGGGWYIFLSVYIHSYILNLSHVPYNEWPFSHHLHGDFRVCVCANAPVRKWTLNGRDWRGLIG